ncbi:3-oxoacyl-[acyl-carrier protein] reductase [Humibacillus xanthopallidus]|uniref:3-oxoacyl-[acyl-carrier protein] reductase n=1 Tax=Humibacillus xanthopallidus TaxID=412689 RepID=A0A543PQZ2_9MICO|nr:SDR family oxidoreductase [Humibacillus xanthopallidus]TQN46498.1 3-oxoacyl-[acyl-carrier protein] reductase [Humibacillus xanthopallidus]
MTNDLQLTGRTAVVTGGTRGLGAAMSERLASAGAAVIVVYREQSDIAEKFVADLPGPGVHRAVQADLSDKAAVENLAAELAVGDAISVLVNNAGRILRPSEWSAATFADSATTFAEHVIAPILLIKAVAPGMKDQGFGRIINIHTTYADKGSSAVLAYTAAKSALATVTTAMARELGAHGITVNGIAPGNIDTEMTRSAGQGVVDWAISTTPAGRLGEPSEVADALAYLVNNPFITGAVIPLDGGQRLEI